MRRLKIFCVLFLFKVHPDTSLIEFKTTHFVEKRKKTITLLRFNEKSPFLHQNDCEIILYRLNKIIRMHREKNFSVCVLFSFSLIEFTTPDAD